MNAATVYNLLKRRLISKKNIFISVLLFYKNILASVSLILSNQLSLGQILIELSPLWKITDFFSVSTKTTLNKVW